LRRGWSGHERACCAQSGWVRPPAGRWVCLGLRSDSADRLPESCCACTAQCWVPARPLPQGRGDRLVHGASQSMSSGRSCASVRTDGLGTSGGRGRGDSVVVLLVFCRSRCSGRSGRACSGMLCVCLGTAVIQLWTRCGRARRPPAEPPAWSGAGRGDLGSRGAPLSGSRPAR